jgi:hypothetical protein
MCVCIFAQLYDLKGSITGRVASRDKENPSMIAHKDLDVIANQVFFTIGRQRKREVMEQVRASLCVHVHMHMDMWMH